MVKFQSRDIQIPVQIVRSLEALSVDDGGSGLVVLLL